MLFVKKLHSAFMYYSLQHFWHKWEEGDWTVVLGICFRTLFIKWPQFCYFAGVRKSTGRNWQIEQLRVINVANNDPPPFGKIPERSLMPGALLSSIFLVFWITYPIQFLQIVTFPANCLSCNSYSLIVFQNYSEVLVVLTQAFSDNEEQYFLKVSAIDSESNDKTSFF